MTQYLVAIHHPDDYDPSAESAEMGHDIDVLNDEMVAAGHSRVRGRAVAGWAGRRGAAAAGRGSGGDGWALHRIQGAYGRLLGA